MAIDRPAIVGRSVRDRQAAPVAAGTKPTRNQSRSRANGIATYLWSGLLHPPAECGG